MRNCFKSKLCVVLFFHHLILSRSYSRRAFRCSGKVGFLGLLIITYVSLSFYISHLQLENHQNLHEGVGKQTFQAPPRARDANLFHQNITADLKAFLSRPALRDIIDKTTGEIIGDPQFLLDFAIVGHGKCGTTSLQQWLSNHPEIFCPLDEILELSMAEQPARYLILRLYRESIHANPMVQHKFGYKNPGEIRIPRSIKLLNRWFPKTILLVGIRHPILWFESLFNFKVQNLPEDMPSNHWGDPNTLIGACEDPFQFNCVGTHKGLFHVHLAMLGKTNSTADPYTQNLIEQYPILQQGKAIVPTNNPVFLFDVDQLNDKNETRMSIFRNDLQSLLGLDQPLGSTPRHRPGKVLPKKLQAKRDKAKIRICDDRYLPLRTELLRISREASEYLRKSGFLDHPDIKVSSKEYLQEILETRWMNDPCAAAEV